MPLEMNKTAAGSAQTVGAPVTYTVTLNNPDDEPITTSVTDNLQLVLQSASWNDDASATTGTHAFDGTTLTWSVTVPANSSAVLTYSVTPD
jgi:hypothetical protein